VRIAGRLGDGCRPCAGYFAGVAGCIEDDGAGVVVAAQSSDVVGGDVIGGVGTAYEDVVGG
jgi:hypothetical protein